jgi:LacI family transcriptional regulator
MIEHHRFLGFRDTASAAGVAVHQIPIEFLAERLSSLPFPLGLAARDDRRALNVIQICQDKGFLVPEEIAVIGVDNMEIICDLAPVPLTSVDNNMEGKGYEAAALLDRLMDGEAAPAEPIVVPIKGVVIRASTDTLAIPDPDAARALQFLRQNYRDPITAGQAIKSLSKSPRQVSEIFRQYVGHSINHELTRLRIAYAKELLLDPKKKVEGIAAESGFGSLAYFVRIFHSITGQTPGEYRRRGLAQG